MRIKYAVFEPLLERRWVETAKPWNEFKLVGSILKAELRVSEIVEDSLWLWYFIDLSHA